MLKRITAILTSVVLAVSAVIMLSAASAKDTFTVTIAPNPFLDASFHRKEKTKNRGWKIYIRFTNKTDKPIRSMTTSFEMREGAWRVSMTSASVSSTSILLGAKQSDVFGWIEEVPSSVDRIHIHEVETK